MKAVILAAGKSTRTVPLTLTRPKPLLPILNRPVLARQLDALRGAVDGVVVVVGYKQELIRGAFGDAYNGISIEYIEQTEQLGTGHAILQCEQAVDGPFLALNGDDLYAPVDLLALAKETEQAALAMPVDNPRLYGVFEIDEQGRAIRLVEKPEHPASNLASIGVYRFTPEIFDILRKTPRSERGEIEITAAIQELADRRAFRVVKTRGYWLPIGYPWHLLAASEHFMREIRRDIQGEVHPSAVIGGEVVIGRGTVVKPGVIIEGPVLIGEYCAIGPNAYLRPGTVLGDACKIGQAVEIKNSILMDGVGVPHLSYLGDSIVGSRCNLGAGTIAANYRHDGGHHRSMVKGELIDTGRDKLGAILGDDVHTGIHTSIYPGRKLWPGVTTRPGEIVARDKES